MKKRKRLAVLSDFHSGHEYGLTPPEYWRSGTGATAKTGSFERELWKFYTKAIDSIKPIDIVVVNGDCIEGKGERSGSMELVTSDRHRQVLMAARAIEYTEAPVVRICDGTPAHVGMTEDFESILKDVVKDSKVHVSGHDFFSINGVNLDVKHKVGGSSVPHGRTTPLSRARLWNVVWNSEDERQPKADILIRSHVHYFSYCGGPTWLGITTPALTYNSHYGIRQCEGIVDVGIIVFDFEEGGEYSWRPILAGFPALKVRPESL